MHGDAGEGDVLIDKWDVIELSLLVDAKHDFGLDFGEQIGVAFETRVHVFVFLRRVFEVVDVVFLVILSLLFPALIIIFVLVELGVGLVDLYLASLVGHCKL